MNNSWKNGVQTLEKMSSNNSHLISIDETGSASYLDTILKKNLSEDELDPLRRYFTLTACIFTRINYKKARDKFRELKLRHWKNGQFAYKNGIKDVCFHSTEIRRDKGAFSKKILKDKSKFLDELTREISEAKFNVTSITVDLFSFSKRNRNENVYTFALCQILERIVYNASGLRNALVILEARGKKEDKELHKQIVEIFDNNGMWKIGSNELNSKFQGIYFNQKWNKTSNVAYFGLELSDLLCYPINKFQTTGFKDLAFLSFENKFYGYPERIKFGLMNYG